MPTYEHKQYSIVLLLVFALIAFAFFRFGGGFAEQLAAFAVAAVVTLAFVQLTTRIDQRGVSWSFTVGVPGGFIPFEDIADVQITKTYLWEGYGIHWTFVHGWLWNVSGFRGVTIRKRNGSIITLGTDDPQGLCDAIQARQR